MKRYLPFTYFWNKAYLLEKLHRKYHYGIGVNMNSKLASKLETWSNIFILIAFITNTIQLTILILLLIHFPIPTLILSGFFLQPLISKLVSYIIKEYKVLQEAISKHSEDNQ